MKYLLLVTLLTGCAYAKYPVKRKFNKEAPVVKKVSNMDKLERCVFKLIEDNGIKGTDASDICSRIFRRE